MREIVRRPFVLGLTVVAALLLAGAVEAQFRGVRLARPDDVDGRFQFCRVAFRTDLRGDGHGWDVDYPYADANLSIRLSEMTRTPVSRDAGGEPKYVVVRLTDPELFNCPFLMMTEPGGAYFDEAEAEALRAHLLKGGFLWVDDFWGSWAWEWWVGQLRKALPAHSYAIADLPDDHAIFQMLLDTDGVPQISSIGQWLTYRDTSERGADSATATARAVLDQHGRVMVLMTHNTDLGDSWEREAEDPDYFYRFSVPGYAFAINAILYALTH